LSSILPRHSTPTLFPYTTLFRSYVASWNETDSAKRKSALAASCAADAHYRDPVMASEGHAGLDAMLAGVQAKFPGFVLKRISKVDRKSTRLNSSHLGISYAVFCL